MSTPTIRVETLEHQIVDATVLCGFAVPRIHQNFVVYSLDEESALGYSRVYIAALRKHGEEYHLETASSNEDWQVAAQTFKQIVRNATV
ncbi:hypothetical protein JVX91_13100 [Pseudomonas sp. PDNC002]|uniref:hypothetical protein n=1 Tax=Pseudomonas sp. PDNC002 TaxID=2811422 RepID=UPI001964D572|nr:hypothetical protein [Pseudomonas sp. PDNC002]QRY81991.1 hypothetical protein JVX91_13100 [Pseudomonas sp. PDNC002]